MSDDSKADETVQDQVDLAKADETSADEASAGAVKASAVKATAKSPRGGPNIPMSIAGALAAIGLLVGIVGGVFGYFSYSARSVENVRDAVLSTAETAGLNATTIDPRNPEKFKENIESVMTGRALQELRGKGFQQILERRDAPGRLESRVKRAAVTELNEGEKAGKALVYLDVSAKAPGQPDVTKTMGFLISVRKIDGRYLADGIVSFNPIPVANQAGAQPNPNNPNQQRPGGN